MRRLGGVLPLHTIFWSSLAIGRTARKLGLTAAP
jgi:hypothetical protein